jgi:hypothetical protein
MAADLYVAAIDHHLTRSGDDLDPLADQLGRNRVARRAEAHGRETIDLASFAASKRWSQARQRSHHPAFFDHALSRDRTDLAVHAGVDLPAPGLGVGVGAIEVVPFLGRHDEVDLA